MSNTPIRVQSYIEGHWYSCEKGLREITDAVTGEIIAVASSEGMNFGSMLDFARRRGGPALRAMNQHDRARMVKALAQHLLAHKEALYELSLHTGATRHDGWIDIEGGIGALLVMSSKARQGMADHTLHVDGEMERLSRGGSFVGQHVCTPLQGAAIHINAFNFPIWGALEKLGPALIAGVPAIIKPATDGCYLTERMVRLIAESGILPDGAVQMIAGGVGDLLDHTSCQDVVSFTGSRATAQQLRQHPVLVGQSTRFIAEQDSLNASVLGLDISESSPEFGLFVKEVVNEMTTKAGQKCTAIRRIIAPEPMMDPLQHALGAALDKIRIGNPRSKDVKMGSLAGNRQRQDVLSSVARLRTEAEIVHGDPEVTPDIVDASAREGAFLSPILLRCDNAAAATIVHQEEAFGPVSTLMSYQTPAEAADLMKRGQGSLVASVYTRDAGFARAMLYNAASYHGRMLFIDQSSAKESTGHGSPLPHLIHGGPGRAGGGEEQGGVRGIIHYMQRTALQCSPAMLSQLTNQWQSGAAEIQASVHPFRRNYHELQIGETLYTEPRTISMEDISAFADSTGDRFYAHTDEAAAAANPFFEGRVAHGYLLLSYAAGLFVEPSPGPVLANTGLNNLRFLSPVYPGETIQVRLTVRRKTRRTAEYGEVAWDVEIFKPATGTDHSAQPAARYELLTMVAFEYPLAEKEV